MDDSGGGQSHSKSSAAGGDGGGAEPVRSRWTPKPEQILILESIFNSGMVNPPKEETVRIRKLLEKFGAVGDANVFYWFQNRRSRSRRRQRQLQTAAAASSSSSSSQEHASSSSLNVPLPNYGSSSSQEHAPSSSSLSVPLPNYVSSPSSFGFVDDERADDVFTISQMNPLECSSHDAAQYQSGGGSITVFINGMMTEVPRGAFNLRAMFGQDALLLHSSGELVAVDEFGVLMQGLQMGESYFLVSST